MGDGGGVSTWYRELAPSGLNTAATGLKGSLDRLRRRSKYRLERCSCGWGVEVDVDADVDGYDDVEVDADVDADTSREVYSLEGTSNGARWKYSLFRGSVEVLPNLR
mmetsp:Transcript_21683/g.30141  ORF Transcript_21683/g.30141 Transcript_21683/m.30141 type:complete len:107 (-) Transcript_21683:417-737(-)